GKKKKRGGEVGEAGDVLGAGAAGCKPNPPIKIMEDVPCEDLPAVIAGLVKHGSFKVMRQQLRKITEVPIPTTSPSTGKEPEPPKLRASEIPEGGAKLVRVNAEEIAVFKPRGEICA